MEDLMYEDFAHQFGTMPYDISLKCRELIIKNDFRYVISDGTERDNIILNVLNKIDSDTQFVGSPRRKTIWEKGWNENLSDFIDNDYDLNKLVPKYYRPNQLIRLNQNYIITMNPNFETAYFEVFKCWLFEKYLGNYDSIYEFGCGTGVNLVALAKLYPQKKLYGLDFVSSSVKLVNKIGKVYKWNISGHLFDMIKPDNIFKMDENSAIFTVGAIEQLASKFELFIQFI